MTRVCAVMLEGSNGQSFFLKESLLAEGLASEVDVVSYAEQAMDLLNHSTAYDLVVINLVEAWEQGMKLGFWLSQKDFTYSTILIVPKELDLHLPSNTSFTVLTAPLSLQDFTTHVRTALQTDPQSHPKTQSQSVSHSPLNLHHWPNQPHSQEHLDYLIP